MGTATATTLDGIWQDLRFTLRSYRRQPGFALTALATLTIGIGACTAIFSVVNAVILRPLPYPDPDQIVQVGTNTAASAPKLAAWARATDIFESLAAYRGGRVNLTTTDAHQPRAALQVASAQADVNFFTLFGATVVLGRGFTADDDRPHAGRVVLLSHRLWERQFGGDPSILGRRVLLDNDPHTVIGVLSERFDPKDILGFAYWGIPQVWTPLQLDRASLNQGNDMLAAGRLAPGVTLDMARARLEGIAADFRRTFPGVLLPNVEFGVEFIHDAVIGDVSTSLRLLTGAVGFVLLIACANVASLLLARATVRGREIAIRAAIGAGRRRIVSQLLIESLALALAGGVSGLIVGLLGVRALVAINPGNIPRIGVPGIADPVPLDWRVFAFTATVALMAGLMFGVIPALHASRGDLQGVMKQGGGQAGRGGDGRRHRIRSIIVIAEVALAVSLLIGVALLIRSLIALNVVDPGFDPQNVLTMRMSSREPRFSNSDDMARLIAEGRRRVGALPGVEAVGATYSVPAQGYLVMRFTIVGLKAQGPYHAIGGWGPVSPGYFEVFRIPLRRGRVFTERDGADSTPVVIVSESLARQFFPDQDPLGQQLVLGRGLGAPFDTEPVRQIVGVVGDVHDSELSRTPRPTTYIPQSQISDGLMSWIAGATSATWVVRTDVEPHAMAQSIGRTLQEVSGGVPVSDVRSMDEVLSRSRTRPTFETVVLTVFGLAALVLATVGIYGLMSHAVQERVHEIGVRIAMGAGTGSVRRMVIWQGMRVVIPGIAIGLVAAFAVTQVLSGFLFGVSVRDSASFVVVPALLATAALIALWLPARAACRIDPVVALRAE